MSEPPAKDVRKGDWRQVRKLLCVRLDAMGDVLMTTPALHAAKESGVRHVTLLTSPAGAGVGRLAPDVDEVLVYESPWLKATPRRASSRQDHDMIRRLEAMRFDAAVIFTVYSQNPLPAATLAYLADIPLRLAHCRENPYQLLTDWVQDPEPQHVVRHEVRRQLDLVESVGWRARDERLRIAIPAAAAARVGDRLRELELDGETPNGGQQPWAVLHPGASAPSRRYPAARFAEVVRALTETHGWRILLTGTDAEASLLGEMRKACAERVALAGSLNVAELAALLARAPLLISNNTGPAHLAAAVGTPVVDLYALTNPQHTPWQVPSHVLYADVPCRICYKSVCPEGHHRCLTDVPSERVIAAALDLMRTQGAQAAGECAADECASAAWLAAYSAPITFAPANASTANVSATNSRSTSRRRSGDAQVLASSAPQVDVLIPTCNRGTALAVTLTGLAAQTYRNFRVIVSDQSEGPGGDGRSGQGDDGRGAVYSREVLAASRVLRSHGCEVQLLQHVPRRGVAENRQYLLSHAEAPYVLCLDDDLILEPYVLEMLVAVLDREHCGFAGNAVIGLNYADDLRPHEQAVSFWDGPVVPEEVLPDTGAWQRYKLHNAANLYHVQRRLGITPEMPRCYRVAWVSGCILYDRRKLTDAGGFSFWKELPAAHCGEDVLAQLRVMKAYGGCGVMPSGVYHQELPTTVPRRDVEAARVLGWGARAAQPAGSC